MQCCVGKYWRNRITIEEAAEDANMTMTAFRAEMANL